MVEGSNKVFEYKEDQNGRGQVVFRWSQDHQFIAVVGSLGLLYILDKRGAKKQDIHLQDKLPVTDLQWDKDTELIAVLQPGLNKLQAIDLDTPKASASFIRWSKTHPILAMGTEKGALIFYNKKSQKKTPTVGKHTKKIISGDWNEEGYLTTGGSDKIISVSDCNSNPIQDPTLVKFEPKNLQWSRPKTDQRNQRQRTICAVLNQKTLLMYDMVVNEREQKQPLELVFEKQYGNIIDYSLFGDGYIVVAFQDGWVAHVSTLLEQIREEVKSERVFQSSLDAMTTNDQVYKMACAGENMIKIYSMQTWTEIESERIILPKHSSKIVSLQWSQNGQVLVASNQQGQLFGFLTSIPLLTSSYQTVVAILSSFITVSIMDISKTGSSNKVVEVQLEQEPQFICLSPFHLAVGANNIVAFYQWFAFDKSHVIKNGSQVLKRDYLGKVKSIKLNRQWAAVLAVGNVMLHLIQEQSEETRFSADNGNQTIQEIELTPEFLIMLDVNGKIKFHHLEEQSTILEFNPQVSINRFYSNTLGTRLICIDKKGQSYLFESSIEELTQLKNFPQKIDNVLFDSNDNNLFAVQELENVYTYTINKNNIYGMQIQAVRELQSIDDLDQPVGNVVTRLERGVKPLSLKNGVLRCFSSTGNILSQSLTSHSSIMSYKPSNETQDSHYRYFLQCIQLHKYNQCLVAAKYLESEHLYNIFGRRALEYLELEIAIKAFQAINNLSMVMTIQNFIYENERNIVFGNVAMILNDYDYAQKLYLRSTAPLNALDMRCDVQDYVIALQLSKQIAPEQEPFISKRLAMQIESQGHSQEARKFFEKGLLKQELNFQHKQHNLQCLAGVSRCSIKLGDIQIGVQTANKINDKNILIEIAVVFENMKHEKEAAEIYERCDMLEKAIVLYITQKLFDRVAKLIGQIQSPNILSQYAKSLESDGQYQKSEAIYVKANDWENVIRLNLNQLNNMDKAKQTLRSKCQTSTMALKVSQECEKQGIYEEAIEFMIMGQKKNEAFLKAESFNHMNSYVKYMKNGFTLEERLKVAKYFEGKNDYAQAGEHYSNCNQPQKALKMFYKAGESYIGKMIDLVVKNKSNQSLIQSLQDYLTGEIDNNPKDPLHLLDFYFHIDDIDSVVKITIIIAQDFMEQGEYEQAHKRLFQTTSKLREKQLQVPYDLNQKLMIVHSYNLVKKISKNYENCTYLLNRVSTNISQFPKSTMNILINTVIFATKAQNMYLAFKWARECMRPENRSQIGEKFKPKIEKIVMQGQKPEVPEPKSQCPFCQEYINDFQLNCGNCQNQLPFCIASGKHIIHNQATKCPKCNFFANIEIFKQVLSEKGECPMCSEQINPRDLKEIKIDDYKTILKQ